MLSPYSIIDFNTGEVIVKYRQPVTQAILDRVHLFCRYCFKHFSALRPTELRTLSQALGLLAEFAQEKEYPISGSVEHVLSMIPPDMTLAEWEES